MKETVYDLANTMNEEHIHGNGEVIMQMMPLLIFLYFLYHILTFVQPDVMHNLNSRQSLLCRL